MAMKDPNPVCFFDINIDLQPVGRIEMTLRKDIVPKTVENFRCCVCVLPYCARVSFWC